MRAGSSDGNQGDGGTPQSRRRPVDLDDIDRQLCQLLADDPTLSRRELGLAVGLTDETISARLRWLRDRNVIATTITVDWEAAGYRAAAILRCTIRQGDPSRAVAAALSARHVVFVALTTGCCDLVIALLGVDMPALRAEIAGLRTQMPDVRVVSTDVVVDVPLYDTRTHTLPVVPWSADELPAPNVALDDIDRKLISTLAVAGDESLRSIARRLEVSDATVRSRLQRLVDAGLLRMVTARDPIAFGDLNDHALAFVSLENTGAIEQLPAIKNVSAVYATLSSADVVVTLGAANTHSMARTLARDLRRVDGVRDIQVAHILTVLRHRTHLVRLVDHAAGT